MSPNAQEDLRHSRPSLWKSRNFLMLIQIGDRRLKNAERLKERAEQSAFAARRSATASNNCLQQFPAAIFDKVPDSNSAVTASVNEERLTGILRIPVPLEADAEDAQSPRQTRQMEGSCD